MFAVPPSKGRRSIPQTAFSAKRSHGSSQNRHHGCSSRCAARGAHGPDTRLLTSKRDRCFRSGARISGIVRQRLVASPRPTRAKHPVPEGSPSSRPSRGIGRLGQKGVRRCVTACSARHRQRPAVVVFGCHTANGHGWTSLVRHSSLNDPAVVNQRKHGAGVGAVRRPRIGQISRPVLPGRTFRPVPQDRDGSGSYAKSFTHADGPYSVVARCSRSSRALSERAKNGLRVPAPTGPCSEARSRNVADGPARPGDWCTRSCRTGASSQPADARTVVR